MTQVLQRLERIEKQLDGVGSAIVQMARTEERVSVVLEQNTVFFRKLDALQTKVHELEKTDATQGQSLGVLERVGWIVVTAAISGLAWVFK